MSEVGKALAVAGEAVRKALVKPPCCMEGTGCEMPPCHCSQVAAYAAVAAFLRALPWSFAASMGGLGRQVFLEDWPALAAAVEAAAKEANHG